MQAGIMPVYSKGPLFTLSPRSQAGIWGKDATFTASAIGLGPLSYQWQKDEVPILAATNSTLVLTNLQPGNAGRYSVVGTDDYGSTSSASANLTIFAATLSFAPYPGLAIDGVAGQTYGIQTTTDLGNPTGWVGLTNLTLATPLYIWCDPRALGKTNCYYRAVAGAISIP
jgi:hypothetical protein